MLINITNIITKNNLIIVDFDTKFGNATATWEGDTSPIFGKVDVELDINDEFTWGVNLNNSKKNKEEIYKKNNALYFTAKLLAVNEDNSIIINIGDNIIFLDTTNNKETSSAWIEGFSKKISVYPTNI
jgi:hypothetical protein